MIRTYSGVQLKRSLLTRRGMVFAAINFDGDRCNAHAGDSGDRSSGGERRTGGPLARPSPCHGTRAADIPTAGQPVAPGRRERVRRERVLR